MRIKILFLLLLLLPASLEASSSISKVGSARVSAGKTSAELRLGYSVDNEIAAEDRRIQLRQHIDHGFNDWYAFRVVVSQDKRHDDSLEHNAVSIENRFQLIEQKDHGWDGGVRFIYTHRDGDKTPSKIAMRLMAQAPFLDKWEWRHNTIIEHDIGEDATDGIAVELRNQVSVEIDPFLAHMEKASIGLEIFNDFGRLRALSGYSDQDHQLGPVIKMRFENKIGIQAGYRTGISKKGKDHIFLFSLGSHSSDGQLDDWTLTEVEAGLYYLSNHLPIKGSNELRHTSS